MDSNYTTYLNNRSQGGWMNAKTDFWVQTPATLTMFLIDDEIRMVFHVQFQASRNQEYNHDCLELAY